MRGIGKKVINGLLAGVLVAPIVFSSAGAVYASQVQETMTTTESSGSVTSSNERPDLVLEQDEPTAAPAANSEVPAENESTGTTQAIQEPKADLSPSEQPVAPSEKAAKLDQELGQLQVAALSFQNKGLIERLSADFAALDPEQQAQVKNYQTLLAAQEKLSQLAEAGAPLRASTRSSLKNITVAVERFVLGQGYLVEPKNITVDASWNYAKVVDKMLQDEGYGYTITGSLDKSFYLKGITKPGITAGKVTFPKAITDIASARDQELENTISDPNTLGEKNYSAFAGWLYKVNNIGPGVGMADYTPESGDVLRLQFTVVGFGVDNGGEVFDDLPYINAANKDALMVKIADINQDKANWLKKYGEQGQTVYQAAMKVLETIDSTQAQVDSQLDSIDKLENEKPEDPQVTAVIQKINAIGTVTLAKKAAIEEARQAYDGLTKAQKALITAEVYGKLTAAEVKLKELTAAPQGVIAQIKALPAVDKLTLADETKVAAARAAYDKLTAEQKALVTNYKTLQAAEAKIVELKKGQQVSKEALDEAVTKAANYLAKDYTGEWQVFGFAHLPGKVTNKQRLAQYQEAVKNIKGSYDAANNSFDSWTDVARYAIAVEALGYDAADVEGINIPSAIIKNVDKINRAGTINNAIYALITLNLNDYQLPGQADAEKKLIDHILNSQTTTGGWNMNGLPNGIADPDMTGMALQALASHRDQANVQTAVEAGVKCLLKMINKDGEFPNNFGVNSNSDAQAVMGLAINGVNLLHPDLSADGKVDPISGLLGYQLADGSFMWDKKYPTMGIGMASEQALYALVQVQFTAAGKGSTYDFAKNPVAKPVLDGPELEADNFRELLKTLPKQEGLKYKDMAKLTEVRTAYIKLSKEAKALIAKDELAPLEALEKIKSAAYGEAYNFTNKTSEIYSLWDLMDEVPDPANLTKEAKDTILNLHKAFYALSPLAQEYAYMAPDFAALTVARVNYLDKAYNRMMELFPEFAVIKLIDELPALDKLTFADREKVVAANRAYQGLTAEEKANVTNHGTLTAAIERIESLTPEAVKAMVDPAVTKAANYLKPNFSGEWQAFAFAHLQDQITVKEKQAEYRKIAATVKAGYDAKNQSFGSWTDAARFAIGIEALGASAADVQGINIPQAIVKNVDSITKSGTFNNPVYALITLGLNDYQIKGQAEAEQKLIDHILKAQTASGGWNLGGKADGAADPDLTGMTLQALAGHREQAEVETAVKTAVTYLLKSVNAEGEFPNSFGSNSNSNSQAIMGLAINGVDLFHKDLFAIDRQDVISGLLSYQQADGSILWSKKYPTSGVGMATEQGLYALVQVQFTLAGKGSTYDFAKNPVAKLDVSDPEFEAATFKELLKKLPDVADLRFEDQKTFNEVASAYAKLSKEAKALISSDELANFTAVGAAMRAAAKKAYDFSNENGEVLDAFWEIFDAIPDPQKVTLKEKETIVSLHQLFEALTPLEQDFVTKSGNASLTPEAITYLATAYEQILSLDPALKVTHAIAALPAVSELTLKDSEAIADVRKAYEELSAEDKQKVSNYQVLQAAEAQIKKLIQEEAETVKKLLQALPKVTELRYENRQQVLAVRGAYSKLSAEAKSLINASELAPLAVLEKALTDASRTAYDFAEKQYELVDRFEELMDQTKDPQQITWEDREPVLSLYGLYHALTPLEQDFVVKSGNASLTTAAVDYLDQAYARLLELDPVRSVEALIKQLPATTKLTLADAQQVAEVRKAFAALSKEDQSKVSNQQTLVAAEKQIAKLIAEAATKFRQELQKLPTVAEFTYQQREQVADLRQAFNALPEIVKDEITGEDLAGLVALESAISSANREVFAFEEAHHDQLAAFKELFANVKDPQQVPANQRELVQELYGAYQKLSPLAQDYASKPKEAILGTKAVNYLRSATDFIQLILPVEAVEEQVAAIGKITSLDQRAAVTAARKAYEALSKEQQKHFSSDRLKELVAAEASLVDLQAVTKVIGLIDDLGEITALSQEKAVAAARKAYDDLTKQQKAQVTNLATLTKAEKQITTLKAAAKAAKKVEELISELGEITDITQKPAVAAARKAYDELDKLSQSLVAAESLQQLQVAEQKIKDIEAAAAPLLERVDKMLKDTRSYAKGLTANGVTFGAEWFVMDLARDDLDSIDAPYNEAYYENVVKTLETANGELSTSKYTEYSRTVLALTAIGHDAQAVGTDEKGEPYNLFTYLSDLDKVAYQGINGTIYALIAVDTNKDYHFTTKDQAGKKIANPTTREKLIYGTKAVDGVDGILAKQLASGGWSLTGQESYTIDLTGMALQALAPYNNEENPKVQAAIAKALQHLSEKQNEWGSFGSMNAQNVEEVVQVITALSALKIDLAQDQRFIKDGKTLLDALQRFHQPGSGFMHALPGGNANGGGSAGEVNEMATEQAYYALIAYRRLLNGENRLYDMNDLAKGEVATDVEAVIELLEKLPATITLANEAAVKSAQKAYDQLTKEQQQQVSQKLVDKLQAATQAIKDLKQAAVDQGAADQVMDTINSLPLIEKADQAMLVKEARADYETLTEAQKKLVSQNALSKLETAEKAIAAIIKEAADKEKADQAAADKVTKMIQALGSITKDNYQKVDPVVKAFNSLSKDQRALINDKDYQILANDVTLANKFLKESQNGNNENSNNGNNANGNNTNGSGNNTNNSNNSNTGGNQNTGNGGSNTGAGNNGTTGNNNTTTVPWRGNTGSSNNYSNGVQPGVTASNTNNTATPTGSAAPKSDVTVVAPKNKSDEKSTSEGWTLDGETTIAKADDTYDDNTDSASAKTASAADNGNHATPEQKRRAIIILSVGSGVSVVAAGGWFFLKRFF